MAVKQDYKTLTLTIASSLAEGSSFFAVREKFQLRK